MTHEIVHRYHRYLGSQGPQTLRPKTLNPETPSSKPRTGAMAPRRHRAPGRGSAPEVTDLGFL